MYHSAGHPLIGVSDDAGELLWYPVVSQELPESGSIYTVEGLFVVHKVHIYRRVPLQGLFDDDPQRCYLVSAGSVFAKACLLVSKLAVYLVLQSV
jgi:hypothetical protein